MGAVQITRRHWWIFDSAFSDSFLDFIRSRFGLQAIVCRINHFINNMRRRYFCVLHSYSFYQEGPAAIQYACFANHFNPDVLGIHVSDRRNDIYFNRLPVGRLSRFKMECDQIYFFGTTGYSAGGGLNPRALKSILRKRAECI